MTQAAVAHFWRPESCSSKAAIRHGCFTAQISSRGSPSVHGNPNLTLYTYYPRTNLNLLGLATLLDLTNYLDNTPTLSILM
jgi:hypothetical protein